MATQSSAIESLSKLKWNYSPEQIASEQASIVAKATQVLDKVGACTGAACTFENVVDPLMRLDAEIEAATSSVTFVKDVSTDGAVRDAAAAAQSALSAFEVKAGMRMDVFTAMKTYVEAHGPEIAQLTPEIKRFVERSMRDFKRRGLDLPADKRAEVEAIKTITGDLCIKYQKDLGEWRNDLYFTVEELGGMPQDFVDSLETAKEDVLAAASHAGATDGKPRKVITLSYPHVVPILKQCKVSSTRAAVEAAFNSRCVPGNVTVLEKVVQLRRYAAHLLGYPSHSAYVLEDRMAGSPNTVSSFLETLRKDLLPLHDADLAALSQLKEKEEGPLATAGRLSMSDYRYYQEQELADKYSVDHDALKAYFPLSTVLDGMLKLYQEILSLRFEQVPAAVGGGEGKAETWHPDVTVWAVYDNSGSLDSKAKSIGWQDRQAKSGELMGIFYLDMHPRPGKYNHVAVFPLLSGCDAGDGRIIPVAACVCNFTKPTADAPSLLRHEEAETFFHEFGHVMHHICSRTRTLRFSSFRCENDFVECPSQMLENWCWDPALLQRLSSHYKSGEPLPLDLGSKLAATAKAHAGLMNTRQVFLATLDFTLHSLPSIPPPRSYVGVKAEDVLSDASLVPVPAEVDTTTLLQKLHADILGIPYTPGTNFSASFGHLVGGYDSQYYGYLYSEVFAQDMFETVFRKSGLTDPVAGYRYRSCILAPGGARDAMDSLVEFLGRAPSNKAFLRHKGLPVTE